MRGLQDGLRSGPRTGRQDQKHASDPRWPGRNAPPRPTVQVDVAANEADRGALVAEPDNPAPLSRLAVRRHDPRQEPGAVVPLAGICAGDGEQSPPLRVEPLNSRRAGTRSAIRSSLRSSSGRVLALSRGVPTDATRPGDPHPLFATPAALLTRKMQQNTRNFSYLASHQSQMLRARTLIAVR